MANSFKRAFVANVGTSLTTVYTTPASNVSTIIGLTVSNISTSQVGVDIVVGNASYNFYLVKNVPVLANASIVAVGGEQKVVLEAGDQVKVKSDASTSVDVVLSFLETTL